MIIESNPLLGVIDFRNMPFTLDMKWGVVRLALSKLAEAIEHSYKPEVVIGILEGGQIPARMLSKLFGLTSEFILHEYKRHYFLGKLIPEIVDRNIKSNVAGKAILLVDDFCDTGVTMKNCEEHLFDKCKIKSLRKAVIVRKVRTDAFLPDYFAYETNYPIRFPWEREEVEWNER